MFDRILLALDDSPAGEVSVLFAGALARRTGASVHVLHVNERFAGGNGLTARSRREATELVTGAVRQLSEGGVTAGGSVRESARGGVPARVVAAAHEHAADVIVLGSHRHRRLGRLLSAKVRERVTCRTTLPVLTAPSPLRVTSLAGAGDRQHGLDAVLDSLLR